MYLVTRLVDPGDSASATPSTAEPSGSPTASTTTPSEPSTPSEPTSTVTVTVTPSPAASCGTSAEPCVVTADTSSFPVQAWQALGLVILLLAAILAAQLRRP